VDAWGGYRELTGAQRVAGDALFLGAVVITGLLERVQLRLRRMEKRRWWASNGRDVLNGVAFLAMALGLGVVGFTGPMALAVAASLLLSVTAVQAGLGGHRLSGPLALVAACALGLPVVVAPRLVHGVFRALLDGLFGSS
jgi:hypothetical protein